jgi:DNA-binding transcriptional ArsR family regulator
MDKKAAIAALSALGQETRLDVFRHLVTAGPKGVGAGDLAQVLDVRANTLSTHLAALARAGLIEAEREGRAIRYRAHYDGIRALFDFLLHDCCKGRPELCGPHVQTASDITKVES